jgi:hypothetical protein
MVRGIMTQHVMEAVSREMFGGAQGRKYLEQSLPQVESASGLDAPQKPRCCKCCGRCRLLQHAGAAGRAATRAAASRCRTPCKDRR